MAAQAERVASQAEQKTSGPLLDRSGLSLERLPGLVVVFDQMTAALSEGLLSLCATPATFTAEKIEAANLFEALDECQGLLTGVLYSEELDARALVVFDHAFVDTLVHTTFGGGDVDEQNQKNTEFSGRPPTLIETSLVEKIARLSAQSLETGFTAYAHADFAFERQEAISGSHILGRRDMPVLAAHIRCKTPGGEGTMIYLLPQAMILPIRQKLSQDPWSDVAAVDPQWSRQIRAEVSSAHILLAGVLEKLEMTLGEVNDLAVGQVLELHGAGVGRVTLECEERSLFWCKVSQSEGHYVLEIQESVEQEKSLLEEVLSL